ARGRVIQLGARGRACVGFTTCDQDAAVGQQRGGMSSTFGGQAASDTPGCCDWIIQLGARKHLVSTEVGAARNQHFPVGQKRGGVDGTRRSQAARRAPRPGGRLIHLGARLAAIAARDQDGPIGQQRGGVIGAGGGQAAGRAPRRGGRVIH